MANDPIAAGREGQGAVVRIDPAHTRAHLNMVARMIQLGTLSPKQQQEIRDQAMLLVRTTKSERIKAAALRVATALERNDLAKLDMALAAAGVGRQTTVNIQNNMNVAIEYDKLSDAELVALAARELQSAHAHPEQTDQTKGQRAPGEDPPAAGSGEGAGEPLF